MSVITEQALYRVTLRSRLPIARPFQDWVTGAVLPTIRKEGAYVLGEERLSDPNASASDLETLNEQIAALC